MTNNDFAITKTSPVDAKHLLDDHHALMQSLFPAESCHYFELSQLLTPDVFFFGAWRGDEIIGCGALALRSGYGEVKSMYVDPKHRRKGVAKAVLKRLISEAKLHNLPLVRLETGDKLTEAHTLYQRHGFAFRGPFGDYPDLPESMFMEKRLH